MAFTFDGFEPANTTPVPDILFDVLLPELNEAQLKVMLYIIRRTLGFKKTADAISLRQFRYGITTKDKKQLDKGCGLKNFTTISKALKALEAMNCIERATAKTDAGDDDTTVYRIKFVGTTANVVPTTDDVVPSYAKRSTRTTSDGAGVLRETEPQLNSNTRNSTQETDRQEGTFVATSAEDRNAPTPIDFQEQRKKRDTEPRMPAISLKEQSSQQIATVPPVGEGQAATSPVASVDTPQVNVQRGAGGKRTTTRKPVEPIVLKSDTRELHERINAHRGYALEEKGQILQENIAIKTWCSKHEIGDYDKVMERLKHDPYWGKSENYYRIGGVALLKETPKALAAPAPHQHKQAMKSGLDEQYSIAAMLRRQEAM